MKKSNFLLIISFVVLIGIIAITALVGILLVDKGHTYIEGEVVTEQVTISGKLPGRVEKFFFTRGDKVQAGDTLVLIHCPEVYAQYNKAIAMQQISELQNQKVQDGTRKELVEAAFQIWQKSIADLELAKKTYQRVQNLFKDGVVTQQRLDEVETIYKSAVAAEKAANAQYTMAQQGAQKQDKQSMQQLTNVTKGSVSEVEAFLVDTRLTSPINGEIAEVYPTRGELVGPGSPLMDIYNLDSTWVSFNIREDYLDHFKIGTKFRAEFPALNNQELELEVKYMNPLGSYATWTSSTAAGTFNIKTFEVLAYPSKKNPNLRPGMTALVKIEK